MSFIKKREKRPRTSSNDANNSFVKSMTSRMSGLLPATITKWFSSPSSSNTNGSAQTADATDSSTEDEAPESPVTLQPPAKRTRFSPSSTYNFHQYTVTDANETLDQCSSYNAVPSTSGRSTLGRETSFMATPYRQVTEEKTAEDDKSYKTTQHTVTATGPTVATKRKSLFDPTGDSETYKKACERTASNTSWNPTQPHFKASLLGSPFYSGRTMYGGAATSYINRANIKERKNTLVNESSKADNSMSHAARCIMDLLEHYSSPLAEAKRIPVVSTNNKNSSSSSPQLNTSKTLSYKTQELHVPSIASILRVKRHSRLMDTTNAARQIIASHSSTMHDFVPYSSPSDTDNNKFTTKMKSKQLRLSQKNIEAETRLPEPLNLPDNVLEIDQNNLPTFTLDLPTPKPACSMSSTSSSTFKATPIPSKTVDTKIATPVPETKSLNSESEVSKTNPFKFSSPINLIDEDSNESERTPPKFTFGSPDRGIDNVKTSKKKDDESSPILGTKEDENKLKAPKSKDWQCPSCWVSNKPDADKCVCCSEKKPSNSSSQSKSTSQSVDKPIKFDDVKPLTVEKSKPKWNCKDCWVSNDESSDKCVCCGASNPNKANTNVDLVANSTSQPLLVKKDLSKWNCKDCWISNDESVDKCVCCGASNPNKSNDEDGDVENKSKSSPQKSFTAFGMSADKPAASTAEFSMFNSSSKPKDDSFKIKLAAQSNKWECPGCLVRNDNDKTRCVCCDHESPLAKATNEPAKKTFNFGAVPAFKFGINAQTQEAAKPAEVKAVTDFKKTLQESETNNNVLPKTPTFTFGLPTNQKTNDTINAAVEKTDNVPKFSFGIPNVSTVTTPSNSIFGNFAKPPEIAPTAKTIPEEEEKPQEVPKVVIPVQEPPKPSAPVTNFFATSFNKPTENKPATIPPLLSSAAPAKKEEPKPTTLTSQPETSTTETTPKPLFTLPTTNIFAQPSAPATTTVSFGSLMAPPPFTATSTPLTFTNPLQTASTTSTSFFQQNAQPVVTTTATSLFANNTSNSTGNSLFQSPSTVTTTSTTTFSSTPIFNFGSNNNQTEKPKFNLSFGSGNKTSSPFGSMFNTSTENKFSLGAVSSATSNGLSHTNLSGANGLSVNPLGGGNGISMNNPLGSNIMSPGSNLTTNTLGASQVPSNPLTTGNGLQTGTGGLFGTTLQKENMWSTSNNNSGNLFGSDSATATQKPAAFTFGSSSTLPAFGSNNNNVFGNNTQATPVFGMPPQSTGSAPSLFGSPAQSQPASVFGAASPVAHPTPSVGLFGSATPSVGATPTFGTPSQPAAFEAPSLAAGSTPAFTFGSTSQQPTAFGFGQDQQPQQPGVYNFGGTSGTPQFNIGNAGQTRRIRKAVRRTR